MIIVAKKLSRNQSRQTINYVLHTIEELYAESKLVGETTVFAI